MAARSRLHLLAVLAVALPLRADAGEAKRKTLRYCRQQGGKGCKIDRIIESPAAWVSN